MTDISRDQLLNAWDRVGERPDFGEGPIPPQEGQSVSPAGINDDDFMEIVMAEVKDTLEHALPDILSVAQVPGALTTVELAALLGMEFHHGILFGIELAKEGIK